MIIKEEKNAQCVTLKGNIYSSTGAISGGYIEIPNYVRCAHEFKVINRKINDIQLKVNDANGDCERLKNEQSELAKLENDIHEKEEKLKEFDIDPKHQKESIKNNILIKRQDIEDNRKHLDSLTKDFEQYESERQRLEENLKKINKNGANLGNLLQEDLNR